MHCSSPDECDRLDLFETGYGTQTSTVELLSRVLSVKQTPQGRRFSRKQQKGNNYEEVLETAYSGKSSCGLVDRLTDLLRAWYKPE